MNKSYDYVVVGAGLSGCVISNRLAHLGKSVLLLEKRNHVGGNVYDELDKSTGVLVQKYGPHIFHTNSDDVWSFIKDYSEWIPFEMKCGAYINGTFTPSPFNFKTIDQYFGNEASDLKKALVMEYPNKETVSIVELLQSQNSLIHNYANFLFTEDYSLYTAKQWGISPEKVDVSVLQRVPVRMDYKEKYFTDKYQYMPKEGFSKIIEKLLESPNITIETNVDAIELLEYKKQLQINRAGCDNAKIIWTGPIDKLFNFKYGLLPYRSLDFKYIMIDKERFQEYPVVAYPRADGYTRITDYNLLPVQNKLRTIIAYEYPKQYYIGSNTDPYYPINNKKSNLLYGKYLKLSKKYKNLFLLGRLANYKYYNMDQVISEALKLAKELEK